MSAQPVTGQIKGWRVIRAEWTDKTRKLGTPKWKVMSRLFTVRSAADTYLRLARKDEPGEDFEVETVYL